MSKLKKSKTPVLIVGGGLGGLSAALLLAHHGVDCLVVERHPGTSIQYKFAGISPRSMEIFRSAGIEEEIRANQTGDQQAGGLARGKNLADPNIEWMRGTAWQPVDGLSPTGPATCDQHVLEPILCANAEKRGAVVRFNTELVSFEQDELEVAVVLRNRETGDESRIIADYLIAADGADGTTREALGIEREGVGILQHWMNIIFDTDMEPTIQGKQFTSCFITDLNGTFTPRPGGRWLLSLQYYPERGEHTKDFDEDRCRELVCKGAGRADVKADLVDARPWEVAALIAERFCKGRVFLVGDTAHLMPPTGAFGGNTGIHDAHNLAWKLALVLKGAADPSLLESYDSERRFVAQHSLDQAMARLQAWFKDPNKQLPPPVEMVEDYDVVLGQRYHDGALIAEDKTDDRPFEKARELNGRPGSRAPHFAIEQNGRHISTLDLFSKNFVLLTGSEGAVWADASSRIARGANFRLDVQRFGTRGDLIDIDGRWPAAFNIEDDGVVLVRPDGFVAWRSRTRDTEPERTLGNVLLQLGLSTRKTGVL